jgi:arylsulfatase A-like enzyme
VPLIVRLPDGRRAGEVTTGLVELVDLYPTLTDLANLPDPAHELEGTSFRPLLENPDLPWKSAVFSESRLEGYHGRTLRTKRYRYTEWTPLPQTDGETERELYAVVEDPFEHDNLAEDPAHRNTVDALSRRLQAGWQAVVRGAR